YFLLKITSPFGERINPITKELEFHTGIDFLPMHLQTYAGLRGLINKSQFGQKEGYYVQISKRIKDVLFYSNSFHNAKILKYAGETVNKNDVVAISGSTGNSTGVHIHYEIFTYQNDNAFVKELKAKIKWYFNGQRTYFEPLEFMKYLEKEGLD
ncbi:MAG TPA: M23 family metallopeptidase, partial [Spirochaetota bacterium]|nr:M23 family metallopeptidase [Spirochaetota bacterium]